MLSKNSRATSAPPAFPYFRGIRWTRLVSLSVTVKMLSYPAAVVGKPTIKSIVIVSHLRFGMLKGFSVPFGFAVETFDHLGKESLEHLRKLARVAAQEISPLGAGAAA